MNKETQYLLASVVESSQDSIVTIDLNRIITSWNHSAETLYGYTAEEAIGKPLSIVMLPADIIALIDKVDDIISEITVPVYDTIRVHKSGKQIELEIMLSPVRNAAGAVLGISTVARDITKRKMQEQQKDEFIAIASHELKTPVTSIKAYTEILLERLEGLEDQTSLCMIRKLDAQIDRLANLIRTLLDTTKLAVGQLLLKKEQFDLNHLIREVTEDIEPLTTIHTISFDAGHIKPVFADRKLIAQVLNNLISNAIKYAPGGGDVTIVSKEKNNGIEVSIQDFGIGIPASAQNKIFDRYFRASDTTVSSLSGVGLGLYITAEIIRQHDGTISVKSEEGEGSTFFFTLPYNRIEDLET